MNWLNRHVSLFVLIVLFIGFIRVGLTAPNGYTAIIADGFDILAGHSTSIGFNLQEKRRLGKPYSICSEPTKHNIAAVKNDRYSYMECKNLSVYDEVIAECGCFPTTYVTRRNYSRKNISSCGHFLFVNETLSNKLIQCQNKIIDQRDSYFAAVCDCHVPWRYVIPCHKVPVRLAFTGCHWFLSWSDRGRKSRNQSVFLLSKLTETECFERSHTEMGKE